MNSAEVRLQGLSKHYHRIAAVDDVSLEFAAGRVHAVIGENGAGKSTLLKIAAGILEPDAGAVRIDGSDLRPHTAREAIRRGVGMVQQHFALVAALSRVWTRLTLRRAASSVRGNERLQRQRKGKADGPTHICIRNSRFSSGARDLERSPCSVCQRR